MEPIPAGGIAGKPQLQDAAAIALSTPRGVVDVAGQETPRWAMLYGLASEKTKRLETKRQQFAAEQQRLLDKHSVHRSASSKSENQLGKDGKDDRAVWSRLMDFGTEKAKKLEAERRRLSSAERVWLKENNIHAAKTGDTTVIGQRLYEEAAAREKRIAEMRERKLEEERRRLEVRSVHLHAEPLVDHGKEQIDNSVPCWQRLNKLAAEREASLQEKRRRLEEEEKRWLDENNVHGEGGAMKLVVDAYERERERLRSPRNNAGQGLPVLKG